MGVWFIPIASKIKIDKDLGLSIAVYLEDRLRVKGKEYEEDRDWQEGIPWKPRFPLPSI